MAAGYGEERATWEVRRTRNDPLAVEATVDPWPFAGERVEAEVPARLLVGTKWEDAAAFAAAWEAARPVAVEVALVVSSAS